MISKFEKIFKWAKINRDNGHQYIHVLTNNELFSRMNQFDSESEALSAIQDLNQFNELILLTLYVRVWSE